MGSGLGAISGGVSENLGSCPFEAGVGVLRPPPPPPPTVTVISSEGRFLREEPYSSASFSATEITAPRDPRSAP